MPADVTVFEVDQPAVPDFRHDVLAKNGRVPTCRRVAVSTDVTNGLSHPLRAAGFDPAKPVLWIVEGLLMYFTSDVANRVLADKPFCVRQPDRERVFRPPLEESHCQDLWIALRRLSR
ncbi:class I SAM-dependent methyltransferase [Streptomyces sp. NRRL S-813]|uniref:class I SAM-dependent methyltransferase n=1 Tax=Streptomyces sp. NRRL S-813 TaxID=1463919 RepID=UPI001F3CA6E0|nr:class I SAM-dependent methyltransferase [Streptomyces sp. NRRL S-813]